MLFEKQAHILKAKINSTPEMTSTDVKKYENDFENLSKKIKTDIENCIIFSYKASKNT